MKKQDIRNLFTRKVTELLNQGWTIFPDTMSGSQGEIAHIDLTDGSQILRVLLERGLAWGHTETGYTGDKVTLTVGKAADTWVGDRWDGTIWNGRLEPSFQIEFAEINVCGEGWYIDMDEASRIGHIRMERYRASHTDRRETLGDAFKSAALKWLRKQPKMKTCKPEDIEKVERVWDSQGKRRFEITAKGRKYTLR